MAKAAAKNPPATRREKLAATTVGGPRAKVVGRSRTETIIPTRPREAHQRGLARFLTTGRGEVFNNQRIELTALHRSGREFHAELTAWPARVGAALTFNAFSPERLLREVRDMLDGAVS